MASPRDESVQPEVGLESLLDELTACLRRGDREGAEQLLESHKDVPEFPELGDVLMAVFTHGPRVLARQEEASSLPGAEISSVMKAKARPVRFDWAVGLASIVIASACWATAGRPMVWAQAIICPLLLLHCAVLAPLWRKNRAPIWIPDGKLEKEDSRPEPTGRDQRACLQFAKAWPFAWMSWCLFYAYLAASGPLSGLDADGRVIANTLNAVASVAIAFAASRLLRPDKSVYQAFAPLLAIGLACVILTHQADSGVFPNVFVASVFSLSSAAFAAFCQARLVIALGRSAMRVPPDVCTALMAYAFLQLTWAGLSGSVQSEFPTTLAFAAALVLKVWNYVVVVRYYPRAVEAVDWEQVVEASPIGPRMGVAPGLSRLETAR